MNTFSEGFMSKDNVELPFTSGKAIVCVYACVRVYVYARMCKHYIKIFHSGYQIFLPFKPRIKGSLLYHAYFNNNNTIIIITIITIIVIVVIVVVVIFFYTYSNIPYLCSLWSFAINYNCRCCWSRLCKETKVSLSV